MAEACSLGKDTLGRDTWGRLTKGGCLGAWGAACSRLDAERAAVLTFPCWRSLSRSIRTAS